MDKDALVSVSVVIICVPIVRGQTGFVEANLNSDIL